MAVDPIATYGALVMAKDGFTMSGDMRSGLKATVKYRVPWANVYLFVNALVSPINQTRVGLITYTLPYRLPSAVAATPLYVTTFTIKPDGLDPNLGPTSVLPNQGMGAGEYYKYGIVTVNFEQSSYTWQATDDPSNLNQLDPSNPIPLCEQSVKFSDKMETRKGLNYVFGDGKPASQDTAVPTTMADLTFKFPHVPYLPWLLLVPYVNKVNSGALFGCAAETLLFKAPDTTAKASLIGGATMIEQALVLTLKYNPDGWNNLPKPDGTLAAVTLKGDSSRGVFVKADFLPLFQQLAYSQGA